MAAEHGHVAATPVLLAAGANVTLRLEVYGHAANAPLNIAARSGQAQVIREFARHGVDLDTYCDINSWTTLDEAA